MKPQNINIHPRITFNAFASSLNSNSLGFPFRFGLEFNVMVMAPNGSCIFVYNVSEFNGFASKMEAVLAVLAVKNSIFIIFIDLICII